MTEETVQRIVRLSERLLKAYEEHRQLKEAIYFAESGGGGRVDFAVVAKSLGFSSDPPACIKTVISRKLMSVQEEILETALKLAEEEVNKLLADLQKILNEIPK